MMKIVNIFQESLGVSRKILIMMDKMIIFIVMFAITILNAFNMILPSVKTVYVPLVLKKIIALLSTIYAIMESVRAIAQVVMTAQMQLWENVIMVYAKNVMVQTNARMEKCVTCLQESAKTVKWIKNVMMKNTNAMLQLISVFNVPMMHNVCQIKQLNAILGHA